MRRDLPSGTVTFLFTDIEGSTKLLHELGAEAYAQALAENRRLLRGIFARHGGVEVDTQGDAFFYAFPIEAGAVDAAREAQQGLASGPISVRMGIHTGRPHLSEEGYVGEDVHKGARIAAAGHGGQVLISKQTSEIAHVEVMDLGEHRLKDFDSPVWIYQLGKLRFPPLKTISNTNLPHPASSFVGRERERSQVVSLLHEGARLLTLTGPGGSGKTRLAIEAAAELVPDFRNGVFWVGLATLRDPELVADTIAQTLGAKDGLAAYIGERELLLLLDNLEQVIDAAPALSSLVEACPNLKVLVTSRELLRVQGEVEYPVPPLADPEAVQLFCTRSRREADETIAELCRRLDNLPLAVELAAARTSVLSPAQILERLSQRLDLLRGGREADPRQATLRATIEWSYELLTTVEQRLFARLAVFAGGCSLGSAEEVTKADLDTLQSLVDKSLVRHTEERFWMLETIREYAAERLEESGEGSDLRRSHAEHFLALAEEAEPHLLEEMHLSDSAWNNRLERELDNLRSALDHLEESGDGERALRLAGAVSEFWCEKEHWAEGLRYLESALRVDERPTAARAKALAGAAHMARDTGDSSTGRLRAEEGLGLYRMLGDVWGTANAEYWLGHAAAEAGDFTQGRDSFAAASRLFTEAGDQHYALLADRMVSWMFNELGDHEAARSLQKENLVRARVLGSRPLEATILGGMTVSAIDDGRVEEALSMAKQSLLINRDIAGKPTMIAHDLCRCAGALAIAGKVDTATLALSSSVATFEEIGWSVPHYLAGENEKTLAVIRATLDEGPFAEAWERGRTLTIDEAVALVLEAVD
ncbi:MAG: adenylate/guanylate cyclase domain-containing protein [Actinomycetota bacterium]